MAPAEPDWMKKAERAAQSLQAETRGAPRASQSVYVVLLQDQRRTAQSVQGPWGLYVGQTSRDPDLRFDQHKAGYKSSSPVRRFGVQLLPHLVAHLNPMLRWEALEMEAALAELFRAAGVPWVEGGH